MYWKIDRIFQTKNSVLHSEVIFAFLNEDKWFINDVILLTERNIEQQIRAVPLSLTNLP